MSDSSYHKSQSQDSTYEGVCIHYHKYPYLYDPPIKDTPYHLLKEREEFWILVTNRQSREIRLRWP